MSKKIFLLNDNDESLLSISFALQGAKYNILLFHEPEELVNWAKIYGDSIGSCLLLNGCHDAALLVRLNRLLYSCDLDLKILVVGDNLPDAVQLMAEKSPGISCCRPVALSDELRKLQQRGSATDEKNN